MRLQLFSLVIMGCLLHSGNPFLGEIGNLRRGVVCDCLCRLVA
jgi:hypothetical protein